MKIIHMSRSVWKLQPPFDNVMHTIMYAQCEGHWEMLENICCCLLGILQEIHKKKEKKENQYPDEGDPSQASVRSFPPGERLLSFTASSPPSASSN